MSIPSLARLYTEFCVFMCVLVHARSCICVCICSYRCRNVCIFIYLHIGFTQAWRHVVPYTLISHRACPDIPFSWMMSEAHCSSTDMFAKMVTIWKMELRNCKTDTHNSQGTLWRQVSWGLQSDPPAWLPTVHLLILSWYCLPFSWAPATQI